jgi:hypothetical protein
MRKWLITLMSGACVAAVMTGCDWTGGGGVDSWSDSYNWVNFSGVYNPASGTLLVSAYTDREYRETDHTVSERVGRGNSSDKTYSGELSHDDIVKGSVQISVGEYAFSDNGEGTLTGNRDGASGSIAYSSGAWSITIPDESTSGGETVDRSEAIAQGNASAREFSGILSGQPVVAGTLRISAGGYNLTDDGSGSLSGNDGSSGSITYQTGSWSISLPAPIPGQTVEASYQFTESSSTMIDGEDITATYQYGEGVTANNSEPGSSGGIKIYSFTVFQEGNVLTIRDNTGAEYHGSFGSVRSNVGMENGQPVDGDMINAQFTADGVSAAGVRVDIAGTFYASVVEEGESWHMTGRRLEGTWVEENGTQGDIYGQAASVKIDDEYLWEPRTGGETDTDETDTSTDSSDDDSSSE